MGKTTLPLSEQTRVRIKNLMNRLAKYGETYDSFLNKVAQLVETIADETGAQSIDELLKKSLEEVKAR